MTQRLSEEQLAQIIPEVERLQLLREQEFDSEQVKEILQELNLPPELLDEALVQLRRRQQLKVQQRRNRSLWGGVIAALIVVVGSVAFFQFQNSSALARIYAEQDRITRIQDDGGSLKVVERQTSSELYYRVTLKDAPVGKKLELSCDWIDPNGQVVKQNRYQTREITTSVWNTYCRHTIGTAAAPGKWEVRMLLQGRLLSNETFEFKGERRQETGDRR